MSNAVRKYGIFLLIPGIVLGFSVLLKLAAGPYWLSSNYDPSYVYLCNGLHILKGAPVNEALHPGTPLQILFCAVCWLFNIGRSVEDVATHVFLAPEFYLHIVFGILSLLTFSTSFALAVYVYRKTNDKLAAILTQLTALSFLVMKSRDALEPALPIVANVSPEPLLMSMANLFNICLLMNFFAKTAKEKYASTLCWGFVCGLSVAVKLTFLPLLVIPLIVLSWRNRILFVCLFAVNFFVWTLPALSKYSEEWGCFTGFLMNKGAYGGDQTVGSGIHIFLLNWMNIIVEHRMFAGILFASLFLVFWKFARKKWEKTSFFLLAVTLGVVFQFSAVAKNPGAHYLLPGFGLFSSLLVLFYLSGPVRTVLGRRIVFVLIVVFTLVGSWRAMEYRSSMANFTKGIRTFYNHINDKYKGYIFIKFYRSSGLDSALQFGDGWNGGYQFRDLLFRLYPNSYFLNFGWNNYMMSFKDRVFSNDLLAQSSGIIFQGDDTYDLENNLTRSPFSVRLLEKGPFESIYLLTNTTEKQAFMYYAAAVHFLQAGQIKEALACAMQAKALRFQPGSSVDTFINTVTPYIQH